MEQQPSDHIGHFDSLEELALHMYAVLNLPPPTGRPGEVDADDFISILELAELIRAEVQADQTVDAYLFNQSNVIDWRTILGL